MGTKRSSVRIFAWIEVTILSAARSFAAAGWFWMGNRCGLEAKAYDDVCVAATDMMFVCEYEWMESELIVSYIQCWQCLCLVWTDDKVRWWCGFRWFLVTEITMGIPLKIRTQETSSLLKLVSDMRLVETILTWASQRACKAFLICSVQCLRATLQLSLKFSFSKRRGLRHAASFFRNWNRATPMAMLSNVLNVFSPTAWKAWGSSNKASGCFGAAAGNLAPGPPRFHIKVPLLKFPGST